MLCVRKLSTKSKKYQLSQKTLNFLKKTQLSKKTRLSKKNSTFWEFWNTEKCLLAEFITNTWWQLLMTSFLYMFLVHIWTCLVTVHNSLRLILIGWFNWILARMRHLFGMFNYSHDNNEWKRNSWKLYFFNEIVIRNTCYEYCGKFTVSPL